MPDTLRSQVNCQKDFGVNHAKVNVVVNILKYVEVTLGWSKETVPDATGGLAQLMVVELALCETYRTSTDLQYPTSQYLADQKAVMGWFVDFMKAIQTLVDKQSSAKAPKPGDGAKPDDKGGQASPDTKDDDAAIKKLLGDLAGLIGPNDAVKDTYDKNMSKQTEMVALTLPGGSLAEIMGVPPAAPAPGDEQLDALRQLQQQVETVLRDR